MANHNTLPAVDTTPGTLDMSAFEADFTDQQTATSSIDTLPDTPAERGSRIGSMLHRAANRIDAWASKFDAKETKPTTHRVLRRIGRAALEGAKFALTDKDARTALGMMAAGVLTKDKAVLKRGVANAGQIAARRAAARAADYGRSLSAAPAPELVESVEAAPTPDTHPAFQPVAEYDTPTTRFRTTGDYAGQPIETTDAPTAYEEMIMQMRSQRAEKALAAAQQKKDRQIARQVKWAQRLETVRTAVSNNQESRRNDLNNLKTATKQASHSLLRYVRNGAAGATGYLKAMNAAGMEGARTAIAAREAAASPSEPEPNPLPDQEVVA